MAALVESTHVSDVEHSDHSSITGDLHSNDNDEASDEKSVVEDEDAETEHSQNAGWAEAMAKILRKKTSENKPSILLKNRELEKIKEQERKEQLEKRKQMDKKRAWEMMCREKPDVARDRTSERNLQRIATRGVVQLFNAVRKHQKNMEDKMKEVGGSERKRAKLLSSVSKKDFINVLRGSEVGEQSAQQRRVVPVESEEKPSWSILRDDFMMGAAMKDWDKESEDEGDREGAAGTARDYSSDSD